MLTLFKFNANDVQGKEIKANSLYFAKIELKKRQQILTGNIIIKKMKDKIEEQEDLHFKI